MSSLGKRTNLGRPLFCLEHPTAQVDSSSGSSLAWGFSSMPTTTFKHAWVENLMKWVGRYYIIWRWRTHQTHETPANYPSDPFERLGHNVAKDALPVQRKSLTWGQQYLYFGLLDKVTMGIWEHFPVWAYLILSLIRMKCTCLTTVFVIAAYSFC